jgi:ADP-ribose pyrophosphatase YjhB (NUDIX family)
VTSELRFCPSCAGKLATRPAGHPASPQPVCRTCGFVLWQNPKPSVEALILRGEGPDTEVLLGCIGDGPRKGRWSTPGGFMNIGDEPQAALIRECLRELGVSIEVGELIGAFTDTFAGGEIALFYLCELKSGEPRPADIVDDVRWFRIETPPDMSLESELKAIRALQDRFG